MLQHQYRASFSAREKGFGCYEVLGFDVMLDSKLRPVLIEVNHLPSFETSAKIDDLIKSRVIADALMLAGVDESTIKKRIKKKKNVIITPSKGMKNSDSMKKSSSSKVKKVEAPTLSKGRDKEKERKLMLEIENERTLYENEFRGGFERVIPLPVEVGGNPAEDVQKIRELYEELQAAKSRLHKTTHAAEKRLQEIKRKKAEREEKAARLNMIRQKHSAKVMSAASMSTAADQRRISKDGRIFQVSSRLYPGPDNSTQRTQRYNQQNNGNHPNVPYVSSRGMAPAKAVLRTSTITLLAPREMSFGGSNMPTYTYSERNGFVRSSGQSSSIKRSRNGNSSNSNSSKGDSSGFGGRTSNRFGNGGTSSNVLLVRPPKPELSPLLLLLLLLLPLRLRLILLLCPDERTKPFRSLYVYVGILLPPKLISLGANNVMVDVRKTAFAGAIPLEETYGTFGWLPLFC
jgi:hypothetical protein